MYLFWILWGIDAIVTLIFAYFFLVNFDSYIISSDVGVSVALLTGAAALLGGSYWLYSHQHTLIAKLLLAPLAIPSFLYGLLLLVMIIANPRWQ